MPSLREMGIRPDVNGLRLVRPDKSAKVVKVTESPIVGDERKLFNFRKPAKREKKSESPATVKLEDPTETKVRSVDVYSRYASRKVTKALAEQHPTLRKVHLMNAAAALEQAKVVTPGGIDEMHKLHTIYEAINTLK